MLLFSFTLRHLRRHWRLNLAVLLGLTLAAALLAGLPGYASAIAARSLDQSLAAAPPAARNLQVTTAANLSAGLYGRIQDSVEDLIQSRLEIRELVLQATPLPRNSTALLGKLPLQFLHLQSFDKLAQNVRVVDGRLPLAPEPDENVNALLPPPMEVALGLEAATHSGWAIGDRLTSTANIRLDVVGIVEPLDPHDDIWWGDLTPFDLVVMPGRNEDTNTLSLLVHPNTMRSFFPMHSVSWRILVDQEQITADNAQAVQATLINLQTNLGKNRVQVSTGLPQILADYLAQLSRVRMSLFLLTLQAFFFVLYTLAMLTSFLLDRSESELAILSGRGATAWQVTLTFAMESLLLALPAALLLGPLTAQGTLRLWAGFTGESVPAALPRDSWLLAGVATAFGWLALVLPVYPAARRNLLEWQRARARPARLSTLQKLYLDLFLLVLGGLLYWQLNQSGSFVMRRLRDTPLADPLLLLGPSLLLIAVAMVFLRLFPYLLRVTAWASQRGGARGLMLPMGLSRLARDPLKPSRVVLLISLAASLTLFTSALGDSLARSQEEMAHYLAGADLRVRLTQPANLPAQGAHQLADLPGVLAASPIFRANVHTEGGRGIQLLAVDPVTFEQVTRYPTGLTNLTISSLARALQSSATDKALPAIFSYAALPTDKGVGDQLLLTLAGRRLPFTVQGTIHNFPTLSGAFVVVSLPALETHVDLNTLGGRSFESYEAWLRVDPAQYAALISRPELQDRILDDAQVQFRALRADALAQGTSGAFQLNALTLAVLSVAGFLLVHYFAAQQRAVEFSVLRALGLSARQLLRLLVTEGALVILLGLVAGTAIGYGLAHVMVPYLSRALSEALAGVTIAQILVDWPTIARLYALLVGLYALAMLLLLLALMRVGIHRALRIGEE